MLLISLIPRILLSLLKMLTLKSVSTAWDAPAKHHQSSIANEIVHNGSGLALVSHHLIPLLAAGNSSSNLSLVMTFMLKSS